MAGRVVDVTYTTGERVVNFVCESKDEIQSVDYSNWGINSTCTIFTYDDTGDTPSYSISKYVLSPSKLWFPVTEGAEDINPAPDTPDDNEGGD